jgi:hypothetical protein
VVKAVRDMIDETVQGAHAIALATLGLRSMYSKKEIHNVEQMKGLKVRVQATSTEDATFRLMARRLCICPSAACTRRCRPVWWTWLRTVSTSIW